MFGSRMRGGGSHELDLHEVRRNRRHIALGLHAMRDEKAMNCDSNFEQNIQPPNVPIIDQDEIMLAQQRAWVDSRCAAQGMVNLTERQSQNG
jgi:hypothetical protein